RTRQSRISEHGTTPRPLRNTEWDGTTWTIRLIATLPRRASLRALYTWPTLAGVRSGPGVARVSQFLRATPLFHIDARPHDPISPPAGCSPTAVPGSDRRILVNIIHPGTPVVRSGSLEELPDDSTAAGGASPGPWIVAFRRRVTASRAGAASDH